MQKALLSLLPCVALLFATAAHATSAPMRAAGSAPKSSKTELSPAFVADLPAGTGITETLLPAPIAKRMPDTVKAPTRQVAFGRNDEIAHAAAARAPVSWRKVDGGWVAHFRIGSAGAVGLRAGLRIGAADYPVEIRYRAARDDAQAYPVVAMVVDSVRADEPLDGVIRWTGWTYGDVQLVEVLARTAEQPQGNLVALHGLSHGASDPFDILPTTQKAVPLTCNVDTVCETNAVLSATARAVARLIITNAAGQSFFCSGSLINDTLSSDRLFATAQHCGVTTASVAASTQFHWNYERTGCGSGAIVGGYFSRVGAQHLSSDQANDFTLLRVTGTTPPDANFLGWNIETVALNAAVASVHHPRGEAKKVSIGTLTALNRPVTTIDSFAPVTVNEVTWTSGIVEAGSSGSPLINTAGQIIGVLNSGPARQGEEYCAAGGPRRYANYAQLRLAFPRVRNWLAPGLPASDDQPNTAGLATTPTANNGTVTGILNTPTDEDWLLYTFPTIGAWLVYSERHDSAVPVDTFGRIYAADGTTLLASNDNDPFGFTTSGNFLFFNEVPLPRSLYLRVTGVNGALGAYNVTSVFVPKDDHYDIYSLGTEAALPSNTSGVLASDGDIDYFRFTLASAATVTFQTTGSTDTYGLLYNSAFQKLDEQDDIDLAGGNFNFRITRALAAGTYYVGVRGFQSSTRGSYTLAASTSTGGAPDLQGAWWGGIAENGWGLSLIQHGNTLVAGWYLYGSNGQPTWLIMPGCTWNASFTICNGSVVSATGSWLGAYNSAQLQNTVVGTVTFSFTNTTSGTMNWVVNGISGQKTISKIQFGSGSQPTSTNYTDVWWGGTTQNGWGIGIVQEGAQMAGAWYTFNQQGQPVWYLFNGGTWTTPTTHTASLFRSTSSPLIGAVYNASFLATVNAGTVTFSFSGASTGTMTYTVDGVTQSKPIERLPF